MALIAKTCRTFLPIHLLSDADVCQTHPRVTGTHPWLQVVCGTLHLSLIFLYIGLAITQLFHWEQRFIFSVQRQITLSFVATTLTTIIITAYGAILGFLTQKLALCRSIRSYQPLTVTHDSITAWVGLGSALNTLYNHIAVPASVFGTLNIVGYLGCITILHITTPAILSVETFNISVPVLLDTHGVPEMIPGDHNATRDFMALFPPQFLPWLGNLNDSQTLGLFNSSLYEVLDDVNLGSGEAKVSAVGFNISCGYLHASVNFTDYNKTASYEPSWTIDLKSAGQLYVSAGINQNTITLLQAVDNHNPPQNAIVIYTTWDVIDSAGERGPSLLLDRPEGMKTNISRLQFLQCSKSLVHQTGTVDTQSRVLDELSIQPIIYKTSSTWRSSTDMPFVPQDPTLMGSGVWIDSLTGSAGSMDSSLLDRNFVNGYLLENLQVYPLIYVQHIPAVLQLHDIENCISGLVASLFWIGGHIHPTAVELNYPVTTDGANRDGTNGVQKSSPQPPVLIAGSASGQQNQAVIRLHINMTAVLISLGTAFVLMILCIPFLDIPAGFPSSIDGIGILHMLWLCQNHPAHANHLTNIAPPSNINLRTAGLTRVRLLDLPVPVIQQVDASNTREVKTSLPESSSDPDTVDVASTLLSESRTASSLSPAHHVRKICIALHVLLVLMHITVLGLMLAHKEHELVFPVDLRGTISFRTTVLSTAFATTYYSLLLYCTQKAAVDFYLQKYSTLASTHDQLSSWGGLGSSLSILYKQFAAPASVLATLSVFGYLLGIAALHITTPALVSVETFNMTLPSKADIQGIPLWNESRSDETIDYIRYLGGFLPWIENLDHSQTLGLFNGSLYDVLTVGYPGSGTANISAVGFNVTCGYVPSYSVQWDSSREDYNTSLESISGPRYYSLAAPGPDLITFDAMLYDFPTSGSLNTAFLHVTSKVLDSRGDTGFPVILPPGNTTTVSAIQALRCSRSLVTQHGRVDTLNRTLIHSSLEPSLHKTQSRWSKFVSPPNTTATTLLEGDAWAYLLNALPPSGISPDDTLELLAGDIYLIDQLGISPGPNVSTGHTVYLHDIENALANLIASLFWMAGNIQTTPFRMEHSHFKLAQPILQSGSVQRLQTISAVRLDLNPFATIIGLCASIILLILAVTLSGGRIGPAANTMFDSMGLLQTMWLFHHRPEIFESLEHVPDPTDHHLRVAGLKVRVKFVDGGEGEL